jgi:hypothetical protein
MTGHRRDFLRQLRHPEIMQDICGVESQRERFPTGTWISLATTASEFV